jgi:hypothetical protein
MKITKEIELEIDTRDFSIGDLIEEIETHIDCKAIKGYNSDEYIEKMKPLILENKQKLEEIRIFLLGY